MEELTKEIGEIMLYEGDYIPAETFPGSCDRRCPDITKAKNLLGYGPKVPWKEGIRKTVSWYKNFYQSGEEILEGGFSPPKNF